MLSHTNKVDGLSIDPAIIEQVYDIVRCYERVLACFDPNHIHKHVLAELKAYAPLVNSGSYCVVVDKIVEDMPVGMFPDCP